jgi:nucleoside-diphosphate-sugar epimerase
VVTEESPAEPERETGRILRETEEIVLAGGGTVARLAGIYGPGRSVLLRKFFNGEAVFDGDGSRLINQIHRDDAASALALLAERDVSGIFNVADDSQPPQREVYSWLAERFEKPLPPSAPVDPNRKRGTTKKRVSNLKLRALGWEPQWPSFFDAVNGDPNLVALAK